MPKLRLEARHLWILGSAALVGLAAVNATVLQTSAHPAPLFASRADAPSALMVRAEPGADENVRALQSRLKAMGHYDGALDGLMGRRTLQAAYEAMEGEAAVSTVSTPRPRGAASPRDVAASTEGERPDVSSTAEAPVARGTDDPLAALLNATPGPRVIAPAAAPTSEDAAAATEPRLTRGALVRLAQERLAERGYEPGPVDGMMGGGTRAALAAFQAAEGLNVSEALDVKTLTALGLPAGG